ncbi:MAG: HyaD/HybD family hydrogenase maturation endopeptidase [Deferrisomatales bacterium]
MRRVAVIGVGNELLSDEGLGVHAARALLEESWPDGVEVVEAGTAGFGLIPLLEGRDAVLFLDVLRADAPPGWIYRFSPDDIPGGRQTDLSMHQFGLLEALQLGRLMGLEPEVTILAMVPADLQTPSTELTLPVRAKLPAFLAAARREIQRLLEPAPEAWCG